MSLNVDLVPWLKPVGFRGNTRFIEGPELGPNFLVSPFNSSYSIEEILVIQFC